MSALPHALSGLSPAADVACLAMCYVCEVSDNVPVPLAFASQFQQGAMGSGREERDLRAQATFPHVSRIAVCSSLVPRLRPSCAKQNSAQDACPCTPAVGWLRRLSLEESKEHSL